MAMWLCDVRLVRGVREMCPLMCALKGGVVAERGVVIRVVAGPKGHNDQFGNNDKPATSPTDSAPPPHISSQTRQGGDGALAGGDGGSDARASPARPRASSNLPCVMRGWG